MPEFRVRVWIGAGVAAAALAQPVAAQEYGEPNELPFSFGVAADVVSSYVWRGLEASADPNLQPSAWLTWGPLEVGTWGSYSLGDDGFREQDFWIAYYFPESSAGGFAIGLNDYYLSDDFGSDLFEFDGVADCPAGESGFGDPPRCAVGPHTTELFGSFTSATIPLNLLVAYNVHNDPENALYGEAAFTPAFNGFELTFVAGGVLGESEYYYGTDGAALTNLSAGIGRTLEVGSLFIPVGVDAIYNPHFEESFFVARAGIAFER